MYIFLFYHAHFYIGTSVGDGDDDDMMSSKYIMTRLSDGNLSYGSKKKVLLIRQSDGEEYNVVVKNFCGLGRRLSLSSSARNKLRFFEPIVCGNIILEDDNNLDLSLKSNKMITFTRIIDNHEFINTTEARNLTRYLCATCLMMSVPITQEFGKNTCRQCWLQQNCTMQELVSNTRYGSAAEMMYHTVSLSHNSGHIRFNIFNELKRETEVHVNGRNCRIDFTSTLVNGYKVHTEIDGEQHFTDVDWPGGKLYYIIIILLLTYIIIIIYIRKNNIC